MDEDESLWGDWSPGNALYGGDAVTSSYTIPTGAGLTMTNATLIVATLTNATLEE